MKTITLDFQEFMKGNVSTNEKNNVAMMVETASGVMFLIIPSEVYAAGDNSWKKILTTLLDIGDWLCVGVIVFAGGTWMFGNRTKAIELLIGNAIGYIIIRHSWEIMEWLKNL